MPRIQWEERLRLGVTARLPAMQQRFNFQPTPLLCELAALAALAAATTWHSPRVD